MKSKILRYCNSLMEYGYSHTRVLYPVIETNKEFTPRENYSYWQGYKKAANEIYLYLKDLKDSEIKESLINEI